MISAPFPDNEARRLEALRRLAILDTAPEFLYDDVTELASQICDSPICLVSLIDADRQWFKSRHGVDAVQTPRELAFCAHAILGSELFEVEDSRKDPRFHDNPLVTDAPNVVFYAGIPLDLEAGLNVGTLCVIDSKPRKLTEKQKSGLRCLANQVIAHLRLRRANLELESALKAKSTFLATMSHEIRTPMNGILGITNLLLDSTRDPETLEQLRIIGNCGDMLLTLLNDILDISKIESGKLEIEAHPFRIDAVIRNVNEVLHSIAAGKGLHLEMRPPGPPDWVMGDSTRLSQILMNLVGNAIKFTERGRVTLSGTHTPAPGNRTKVTFTIRDQGIGIAPDALARLFQTFTQGDSSTTRRFGGTGLGLAISKGLVEGMGGSIRVASEPGAGSTFAFDLEFPVTAEPKAAAVQDAGPEDLLALRKPMSILLAEDNRVNQIVAMKLLSKLGYQPDLAGDGREAVRLAEGKEYGLILMDCQMPEMDGFEATERILASSPPERRPRIYALTAAVTEAEQARCLAAGMSMVIKKPIGLAQLRQAIQDCPMPGT